MASSQKAPRRDRHVIACLLTPTPGLGAQWGASEPVSLRKFLIKWWRWISQGRSVNASKWPGGTQKTQLSSEAVHSASSGGHTWLSVGQWCCPGSCVLARCWKVISPPEPPLLCFMSFLMAPPSSDCLEGPGRKIYQNSL